MSWYIAVIIDFMRNVNHVSTNSRLKLLSKLFPMAFDTARLDAEIYSSKSSHRIHINQAKEVWLQTGYRKWPLFSHVFRYVKTKL